MSETTKDPPAPRLKHNSALAAAFITQHKVTGRYPRVTEQVECLRLEFGKLFPYGYNPSIFEYEGKLLMAYRWHNGKTLHSDLALAELDMTGKVHHNAKIDLGEGGEDPKLFLHGGEPHISWVETTFPEIPFRSVVTFGRLSDGKILHPQMPALPGNDFSTMQKNWVFFEHDFGLYCIYRCSPTHQTYWIHGNATSGPFNTDAPRWPYGQIRGGTSPLLFEGNLLRFFHSGLDNEFGQFSRRYFMGAYVMRPEPPFEILAVSTRPIVYGAEIDGLKKADREACPQYKRQVVFPGGAVQADGYWLVSVGVNDSACEILKIRPADLRLELK